MRHNSGRNWFVLIWAIMLFGLLANVSVAGDTAFDLAAAMVEHAQPLNYQPTIPVFTDSFADESSFDPALAGLNSAEKLAYFNQAAEGLESGEIKLSGIFSSGTNVLVSPRTQFGIIIHVSSAGCSARTLWRRRS